MLPGWPSSSGNWHQTDLSGLDVPANPMLQILNANNLSNTQANLGVREPGSSVDRFFSLREAKSGGNDFVTSQVNADAASRIE